MGNDVKDKADNDYFMVESKKKYHCRIELGGLPTGGNGRQHWTAKYQEVKKWKNKILTAIEGRAPKKPLEKVRLRYTRASTRNMDHDNLVISFKSLQDGLVEAGIMVDDNIEAIPKMPEYIQEKAPRGKGYVVIEVWEL